MGSLTELYEYCNNRNNAMNQMREALGLKHMTGALGLLNVHQVGTSIDLLMDGISLLTLFTLKEVRRAIETSPRMTPAEKELLNRRALDTGYRLAKCGCDSEKESSFQEELNNIRDELTALYRSRGDHAEVHRLCTTSSEPCRYLQNFDLDMLKLLSSQLISAMHVVFKNLKTAHRNVLDPEGSLKISSTHLALLSDRVYNTIEPGAVGSGVEVDITGRNVLHLAAERGDHTYLQWWLNTVQKYEKPCLETRDAFGLTPIMVAAYQGSIEAFKLLLAAGANLKAQHYPSEKSVLSLAAMAGNTSIVREIFAQGITIQDKYAFCSPIHDAAATGRSEDVINLLMDNKAEPRDERAEYGGKCASTIAKERNHTNIAKLLQRAEKTREAENPTNDPDGQMIRSLKRIIDLEMARSNSPEPITTARSHSERLPSVDYVRGSKRQKSTGQEWQSGATTIGSASSTPRTRTTIPTLPSPMGNIAVGTYSVRTLCNLEADALNGPIDDYILNPGMDYTPFFDEQFPGSE